MTDQIEPQTTGFTIHGDKAKLFEALAAAQAEFREIIKTRENPFFKSVYADLSDVLAACVPALNKHGLALIQPPCRSETGSSWVIHTLLTHTSGAYLETVATIPVASGEKNAWQAFGSAVTYCRRYVVGALLGVAPEVDDDGNEAANSRAAPPQPPQASTRRVAPASAPTASQKPASAQAPQAAEPSRPPSSPPPAHEPSGQTIVEMPATEDTKLDIRVAMVALGYKAPDVTKKLAQVFGPGTAPRDVVSEAMNQQLLAELIRDVENVPGLMARLPEIKANELAQRAAQR